MEYSKKISMDQVSSLVDELKISMAKNGEQLFDYSRGLSRRTKKPIDKGPKIPLWSHQTLGGHRGVIGQQQ
eukprot:221927-Karenia_brevis.AAC.1